MSALAIRGLRAVRGGHEVLRGIDLDVATGEVWALMGLSGAGKTTVLRTIAALEPITAGSITIGEFTLRPGPLPPQSALTALRDNVGMVFQSHALFEHLSVLENVTLAPTHARGWTEDRARTAAMELLRSLGIAERANALPKQISGGQAQRAAIARALVLDPLVLLLDEPTSALDPARRESLATTLRALARDGRALLISTHDVDFARACADRVAVLSHGELVETGIARDVLSKPQHAATKELLAAPVETA